MYAIFFDKDNITYRLPVNPEQIETSSSQAIEKYEILKTGQVAIPTHMELKEFSFECEFPHVAMHYSETSSGFKDADYYINLFQNWRHSRTPVRFIASNGIGEDINTLVLIEGCSIVEKAGEEGDKYINFSLLEFKEYGKKMAVVTVLSQPDQSLVVKKEAPVATTSPKSNGHYIVKAGDSLYKIAKQHYGDGSKYMKIVNANKEIIKNPSLIYPGWKLVIPA